MPIPITTRAESAAAGSRLRGRAGMPGDLRGVRAGGEAARRASAARPIGTWRRTPRRSRARSRAPARWRPLPAVPARRNAPNGRAAGGEEHGPPQAARGTAVHADPHHRRMAPAFPVRDRPRSLPARGAGVAGDAARSWRPRWFPTGARSRPSPPRGPSTGRRRRSSRPWRAPARPTTSRVELAAVFSGEIDFNSELQPGDTFRAAFEKIVRENGTVAYGADPHRGVRERRPPAEGVPLHAAGRHVRVLRRARAVAEAVLPQVAAEVRAAHHVAASRTAGCTRC